MALPIWTVRRRACRAVAVVFSILGGLVAAPVAQTPAPRLAFPMEVIADHGGLGVEVRAVPERLAELAPLERVVLTGVPLVSGEVELQRYHWTVATDGRLSIDGAVVSTGDLDAGLDLGFWSGRVDGDVDSEVLLVFSRYGSRGWLRTTEGTVHLLAEPGPGRDWTAGRGRLIREGDLLALGAQPALGCASGALGPQPSRPAPAPRADGSFALPVIAPVLQCNLALESDTQYYDLFGDTTAALAYALTRMGAVSLRYQEQLGVVLVVTYVGLHTLTDPWTTQDVIDSTFESFDLLQDFQSEWSGGLAPVTADSYQFLSGANLGGGVAWLGVLCQPDWSFSVCGNLGGDTPLPIGVGFLNWDFIVTAHELGHVFGAIHTHEYCPPLDQCAPAGYFGLCQAAEVCDAAGTIMSYCHLCGAGMVNHTTYFHTVSAADMRAFAEGSCLLPTSTPGGAVEIATLSTAGVQSDNFTSYPMTSSDGRFVTFQSFADNLVPGDTNAANDIFVRDRVNGTTVRASVASTGEQGNDASYSPAPISTDGRYVAFMSAASNLVPGDTNDDLDVFVRDLVAGTTTLVSVSSTGTKGDKESEWPHLSDDGRYVAFDSWATNLVPGDTNAMSDVFVHDQLTGVTERVDVDSSGAQSNGWTVGNFLSADGRWVVFESLATNFAPGDTNATYDIYIHDRTTGATSRVSLSSSGSDPNSGCMSAQVSADGRWVVFESTATNLVAGDTNVANDIFLRDRLAGLTTLVSVDSAGAQGNNISFTSRLSADGRYVAFDSWASNLVSLDTNFDTDCFLHDRFTGVTSCICVGLGGTPAGGYFSWLSADGRYAAFGSNSPGIVLGDLNGKNDVFVRELAGPAPAPKSWLKLGVPLGNAAGDVPILQGSGALTAHSPVNFQLTGAAANRPGAFILSLQSDLSAFKGWALWPVPPLLWIPVVSDAAGEVSLHALWPAGVPSGVDVYSQCAFSDPTAMGGQGVTVSDCVWLITP